MSAVQRRKVVAVGASMPAPTNGWDAVSPLAAMDPKSAIVLDNFFPQQGYVELRRGYGAHSNTGVTTPVNTLMPYNALNPNDDKLFAASGTHFYDVTTASSSSVVSGLTNSRWQFVNFSTSANHFLYAVNGADAPQMWNNTAWSNPAITGATASSFINLAVYKRRLLFCETNKLGFWFLPVDSVSGAATFFNLGPIFDMGGYLQAIGNWTFDGGVGPDDHAVFVSSKGQVAIYAGDDPSDPNAWSLVGVYNLPEPIGRRCLAKVAGDLAIVTLSGVLPMSKSLIRDKAVDNVSLSYRIQNAINDAARSYSANFGWEMAIYPKGHMGILNVPVNEGIQQQQFVVNLLSGAWCRFLNQNASCWAVFKEALYFGGNNGRVYEADIRPTDDGTPITADMKTAFNYFNSHGILKRWTMIQPLIYASGSVKPAMKINADFDDSIPTQIYSPTIASSALWDQAIWDVSVWPSEISVSKSWQSVTALGQCAAVRMRVVSDAEGTVPITFQVNGFNFTYEKGAFF